MKAQNIIEFPTFVDLPLMLDSETIRGLEIMAAESGKTINEILTGILEEEIAIVETENKIGNELLEYVHRLIFASQDRGDRLRETAAKRWQTRLESAHFRQANGYARNPVK